MIVLLTLTYILEDKSAASGLAKYGDSRSPIRFHQVFELGCIFIYIIYNTLEYIYIYIYYVLISILFMQVYGRKRWEFGIITGCLKGRRLSLFDSGGFQERYDSIIGLDLSCWQWLQGSRF